ncbi:MAG TPA: glycosyltransferase family 39 protein [Gemmataceae bacterium]|nr:glycosyltransferase family 39 protein [Gemmataceae bacterium]
MGRFSRYILLVLLALGIALRVRQYAACPSYWYDEAYLLLNVFHKSFLELLGPLREDQAAPPLFLWLLRGLYQLVGGSEWWMRLPALAASAAGLLVMAPLARRVAGRRGKLWAVTFCALGHHAAAHAGEVKQYTLDFLMTEAVLLATLSCQSLVRKPWPRRVLCLLAILAPWASYPAVFVLGAASLSLLLHALRRRGRSLLAFWALATGLFAASCLILWQLAVRHQTTSTLRTFWQSSFLDLSSPSAAAAWTGRCLIEIGNYGTREMGLPLVVLAVLGAASLRRRPERLLLLLGPLLLALLASALRLYPLGGRLLFFLVPCVWLLATRGIGVLTRRFSMRRVWLGWVLPMALLMPALLWAGRLFIRVTPRCQLREAFAYVEQRRAPGDVLWVSHPQVYEVYHGRTPDLSAYSPPELVELAARTGRLWMVCVVAGSRERYTAADTVRRVKAASCLPLSRRRFRGLEVVLYETRAEPRP